MVGISKEANSYTQLRSVFDPKSPHDADVGSGESGRFDLLQDIYMVRSGIGTETPRYAPSPY